MMAACQTNVKKHQTGQILASRAKLGRGNSYMTFVDY